MSHTNSSQIVVKGSFNLLDRHNSVPKDLNKLVPTILSHYMYDVAAFDLNWYQILKKYIVDCFKQADCYTLPPLHQCRVSGHTRFHAHTLALLHAWETPGCVGRLGAGPQQVTSAPVTAPSCNSCALAEGAQRHKQIHRCWRAARRYSILRA